MFSYVAKSLLSKTLRTFLRKYLENIELESIDYGSSTVNGISEEKHAKNAGSSGWGVRLSNVKLREGTELMKLPGKRKRVVVVKKRVKRSKQKEHATTTQNPKSSSFPRVESEKHARCSLAEPIVLEQRDCDAENDRSKGIERVSLPAHKHSSNRDHLLSADSETGYFSSGPPTPVQTSSSICGTAPSSFCLSSNTTGQPAEMSERAEKILLESFPLPLHYDEGVVETPLMPLSMRQKDKENDLLEGEKYVNGQAEKIMLSPDDIIHAQKPSDDTGDDDSFIEVEEECTIEDDMALVVGAGGVIGVLNIRLVGKELNVTVEDAHLVIEALPLESVPSEDENKYGSGNSTSQKSQKIDRASSNASDFDASSNLKDEEKDSEATIGEKIKKKSKFANFLSMVPHLFLRDCRVSLILPEDEISEDDELSNYSVRNCTVFELGIDFLSVTSGDDFLDSFRFENHSSLNPSANKQMRSTSSQASISKSDVETVKSTNRNAKNFFSKKRIRTGKGPDGGIWFRINPPNATKKTHKTTNGMNDGSIWARQRFVDSSESYSFRCSGLDLHARMLVETTEDKDENAINPTWSNEYEDYTMDSMLFGVDYVDPITLTRHQIKHRMSKIYADPKLPYDSQGIGLNGIQSIPLPSNLHWIAQKCHRNDCITKHLPRHDCYYCWNACVDDVPKSSDYIMDKYLPLPGFTFCLCVTDPIEFNIDRNCIDALGFLKSFFTSGNHVQVPDNNDSKDGESSIQKESTSDRNVGTHPLSVDDHSFPEFMQPDSVYISGFHISKLVFRIHAMRPSHRRDNDLRFRFWQLTSHSLYFESQQIHCDDQHVRDVTMNAGVVEIIDYFGVCEKNLFSLGSKSSEALESKQTSSSCAKKLPCTAWRILDITPPPIYDNSLDVSRAFHVRLVHAEFPTTNMDSTDYPKVCFVKLNAGKVHIDVDSTLPSDISTVARETKVILLGSTNNQEKKGNQSPKIESKSANKLDDDPPWLYEIALEGGNFTYEPRIKMQIPKANFRLRKGSEGISFKTFLKGLGVEYGSYHFNQSMAPSLLPMCSLPESLRMHILMYVDDLSSLEAVFSIKKKNSSSIFLRIHAINKKLSKLNALNRKHNNAFESEDNRRDSLLDQLHRLDNNELQELLLMHRAKQIFDVHA